MFAICCEESARHFVQAVGFNAEMLVPWAKGFFQDTKLPLKLLELWHLPCSGNSESYLRLKTVPINKQVRLYMKFREFRVCRWRVAVLNRWPIEQGMGDWVKRGGGGGLGLWLEGCFDSKGKDPFFSTGKLEGFWGGNIVVIVVKILFYLFVLFK